MPAFVRGPEFASGLHVHFRVFRDEFGRQPNHRRFGRGDAKVFEKARSNPLIDQDSPVLWVVPELDNVEVTIRRLKQVGLRPAPHFSDQAASVNRHWRKDMGTVTYEFI